MKSRTGTATAALLVLAACSGEPVTRIAEDGGEKVSAAALPANEAGVGGTVTGNVALPGADRPSAADDGAGGRESARIPAEFRGTWARSVEDCAIANHNRVTITDEAVRFFEGGGKARDIRRDGNALAVSYLERTPADVMVRRAVYLALDGDERMRVRLNGGDGLTYRRCPAPARDGNTPKSQANLTVPARFRGLYALDQRACEEDYTYNPAFQNVTVRAREVSFFETGGPVTDVNIDENSIAITLRETVGDGEFTRVIYLALNGDGTVRYRPGSDTPVKAYVRCASE